MREHSALVSVLIPVYNRERYIGETIQCILDQTYKNIEIIIVDNYSTDDTWNIIKEFETNNKIIRAFQNDENIGPVRNWKRCIDQAKGKYAKILWSDDLISPSFIEKCINILEERQDVGFVYSGVEIFDESNNKNDAFFIGDSGIYPTEQYIKGLLVENNYPVSASCALFRLDDLKKNLQLKIPNKIRSDFSIHGIGPDALIFLLTAKDYENFAFINEKLSFFRAHSDSITRSSNSCKLTINYDIVKAYFVEKFITDKKLEKKFNALLLIHYLNCKNYFKNLKCLNDLYMNKQIGILDINFFFILNFIFKKIFKKMKVKIK